MSRYKKGKRQRRKRIRSLFGQVWDKIKGLIKKEGPSMIKAGVKAATKKFKERKRKPRKR